MCKKLYELADKRTSIISDYQRGNISHEERTDRIERVEREYDSWSSHYGKIAESQRELERESEMEREEC